MSQPSETKVVSDIKTLGARVLPYWLKGANEEGCPGETSALWFRKSDATDEYIKTNFLADHQFITQPTPEAKAAIEDLKQTAEGTLGLIIVLDQFSRNMFRGDPRSFSSDKLAQELSRHAIEKGFDVASGLSPYHSVFIYMPFMHAEDLDTQNLGVQKFTELAERFPKVGGLANFIKYCAEHRDIIAKFGRFPHRNAVLQRATTEDEAEFMKTHKGF